LWGDDSPVGLESTVLDMTVDPPMVLRPGGITLEALQTVLPEIGMDPALLRKEPHLIPKSPGMKYTHYAPDAEMILFEGVSSDLPQVILQEARLLLSKGKRVGILTVDEHASVYSELGVVVRSLGASEDSEGQAHNLFSRLREFNGDPVDVILAESVSESGLGQAVMNRLRKASTKKVPVGRG